MLEYSIIPDSGGAGKHRGGLGDRQIMEVTADEITISAMMDRMEVKPFGLFGGKQGASTALYFKKAGDNQFRTFSEVFGTVSANKFSGIRVHEGDQILIQSSGGGGFGNPFASPVEAVLEDVKEGFISLQSALKDYGVLIEMQNGQHVVREVQRDEKIEDETKYAKPDTAPCPPKSPLKTEKGKWVERSPALYDTEAITCDVCGKIMPKRYWKADEESQDIKYCDPACYRMYLEYWKPRYGSKQSLT